MKSKSFGSTLREIREDGSISLRSLAKVAEVDAAYLSRVERELNPAPKAEVIQKIAETLCQIMELDTANCEKLKRTLLESSEQLVGHSDLIRDLKHRFADRLRDEGVEEAYIIDAIKKVSLESMENVLSGKEPLKIARQKSFSKQIIKEMKSPNEEVQMLENVSYGIDRIVSVLDDGRGYAWNKINRCGKIAFAGKPLPPDCPTPPESN